MSTTTTQPDIALRHITAVVSMLHESGDRHSALRHFRGEPVLAWTLRRLSGCRGLADVTVLCWEDQLPHAGPVAEAHGACVLAKGPRLRIASVEAIAASRKWSDGWRGGLLQTCDFDLGFYAPWVREIAGNLGSDAILLIDPASALIDPRLVDDLIHHARRHESAELVFSPAAPGLCGVLLQLGLLDRLVATGIHPGKLLHYLPEQPAGDPCSRDCCLPVPAPVARTIYRFKLDSDRQINRIDKAMFSLNGQLIHQQAEDLVARMAGAERYDPLPREVVLELNTHRQTRPIYSPVSTLQIDRPELSLETARRLFDELGQMDDVRLTLAGVGDPLLHRDVFEIVSAARQAGIDSVHIETDLLPEDEPVLAQLAGCGVDVVSFHLPAITAATYQRVMGVDRFVEVIENLRKLLKLRQEHRSALPLLAPLMVKCRDNLGEMEVWYDQWLRALGSATLLGPSDYAGQIPDVAVADMAPPQRRPCVRLSSRLTVLSDGRIVSCEQDVLGQQVLGRIGNDSLADVWRSRIRTIVDDWNAHPLCRRCREWHRP